MPKSRTGSGRRSSPPGTQERLLPADLRGGCHRLLSLPPPCRCSRYRQLLAQNECLAVCGEIRIMGAAFLHPPAPCFWGVLVACLSLLLLLLLFPSHWRRYSRDRAAHLLFRSACPLTGHPPSLPPSSHSFSPTFNLFPTVYMSNWSRAHAACCPRPPPPHPQHRGVDPVLRVPMPGRATVLLSSMAGGSLRLSDHPPVSPQTAKPLFPFEEGAFVLRVITEGRR